MIHLPYPSNILFPALWNPSNSPLSVSLWMNTISPGRTLINILDSSGNSKLTVGEDGSHYIRLTRIAGSSSNRSRAGIVGSGITYSTWHHIAITDAYTGTNVSSDITCYIDGTACTTYYSSGSSYSTETINGTFNIGSTSFNGYAGEIALYNRVLTATEVAALAKGYSPANILNGLKTYIPLINGTPLDIKSGNHATTVTNATASTHLPIINPTSTYINKSDIAVYWGACNIQSSFSVSGTLYNTNPLGAADITSSTTVAATANIACGAAAASIVDNFGVIATPFYPVTRINECLAFQAQRTSNPSAYVNVRPDYSYTPLPVFCEGYLPGLDAQIASYSWDFGDGSPVEYGFNAAHVYETPGQYTITQTITLLDGSSATTNTILVNDTSTVNYVTANAPNRLTYYVDSSIGNDTYTGLAQVYDGVNGPWQTASQAFSNIGSSVDGIYQPGDQVLFNRGLTYDLNYQVTTGHYKGHYGWSFGTYGGGAKPQINWSGSPGTNNTVYRAQGVGPFYVSFTDLSFNMLNPSNGSSVGFFWTTSMSQTVLINRIDIQNPRGNTAILLEGSTLAQQPYPNDWDGSGHFVLNCNIYNGFIIMFCEIARFACMNNFCDLADNHINYFDFIHKGIIKDNIFTRPAFGRSGLRVSGAGDASSFYTSQVWIDNNYIGGWVDPINGWNTTGWDNPSSPNYDPHVAHNGGGNRYNYDVDYLSPQNGPMADGPPQRIQDMVFQNNITTNFEMGSTFGAIFESYTVRNNKFISPSPTQGAPVATTGSQCAIVAGWIYDYYPIQNLVLENNEFNLSRYSGYYGAAIRISANQPHRNITIKNNTFKFQVPHMGIVSFESEADTALIESCIISDNTVSTSDTSFVVMSGLDLNSSTLYNDASFNSAYPGVLSGTTYTARDTNPLGGYANTSIISTSSIIPVYIEQAVDYSATGMSQLILWVRQGRYGTWTNVGTIVNPSFDTYKKYYGSINYTANASGEYYFASQALDNAGNYSPVPTLPTSRCVVYYVSGNIASNISTKFSVSAVANIAVSSSCNITSTTSVSAIASSTSPFSCSIFSSTTVIANNLNSITDSIISISDAFTLTATAPSSIFGYADITSAFTLINGSALIGVTVPITSTSSMSAIASVNILSSATITSIDTLIAYPYYSILIGTTSFSNHFTLTVGGKVFVAPSLLSNIVVASSINTNAFINVKSSTYGMSTVSSFIDSSVVDTVTSPVSIISGFSVAQSGLKYSQSQNINEQFSIVANNLNSVTSSSSIADSFIFSANDTSANEKINDYCTIASAHTLAAILYEILYGQVSINSSTSVQETATVADQIRCGISSVNTLTVNKTKVNVTDLSDINVVSSAIIGGLLVNVTYSVMSDSFSLVNTDPIITISDSAVVTDSFGMP